MVNCKYCNTCEYIIYKHYYYITTFNHWLLSEVTMSPHPK